MKEANPRIYEMGYLVLRALRTALEISVGSSLEQGNILDVGCGDKPYSFMFTAQRYIGIDLVGGDCIASAENLPFKSEVFDVVLTTQVMEHIQNPTKAVAEIHRVLKKGGHLFLSTHGIWEKHGKHDYWRWTDDGLRMLLSDFRDVEVIPNGGSIMCFCQLLNLYLSKIPTWLLPTKPLLYLINNLAGTYLDRAKYDTLVVNYLAVAER